MSAKFMVERYLDIEQVLILMFSVLLDIDRISLKIDALMIKRIESGNK